MSLASEMRTITNIARFEDSEFDFVWNQTIGRIKQRASEGKNEICWYDAASEVVYKDKYGKYKHMLADKLVKNGFKIKTGFELGRGMSCWNTPYILW